MTHRSPMIKDIPFHPDPTYRPPSKPVRVSMPRGSQNSESANIDPGINIDGQGQFSVLRRHYFGNVSKTGQNILSRT